jgi:hypothetical protein
LKRIERELNYQLDGVERFVLDYSTEFSSANRKGVNNMTKLEKLLQSPSVSREVVRTAIRTAPGSSTTISVKNSGKDYSVKTTVLRKVGTKLVK